MNINGTNWLACTRAIDELDEPVTVYPLDDVDVINDLVGDQRHTSLPFCRPLAPGAAAGSSHACEGTPDDTANAGCLRPVPGIS